MRRTLLRLAESNGGLVTRAAALAHVPAHVVDDTLAAGALARVFPGVYVLPDLAADQHARRRAALAYRPDAALSHIDGLDGWGLPSVGPASGGVHLTCPATRTNVKVPGVCLHRRVGFDVDSAATVTRNGLRVVRIEQAIVEAWPYLPAVDRRAPAIVAVRERRTTAKRLADTLDRQPGQPARAT